MSSLAEVEVFDDAFADCFFLHKGLYLMLHRALDLSRVGSVSPVLNYENEQSLVSILKTALQPASA